MKDLMTPREDTWSIMKLQNAILNVAKYLDDFCTANNIEYCLMSGSAIGAVRHQGFIPWDDDLDVFMRPDEYDKFRKLFAEKGNHNEFYLQEWGGNQGMVSIAKLRLNNSTYIEEDLRDWDMHHGIYVDIWILQTCPDNMGKRRWQYIWSKYLVAKGAGNRGYNRKKGLVGAMVKVLGWLPKRFLVNFALKQAFRFRNESSHYLSHFMGRPLLNTGVYKCEYFNGVRRVPFEAITLNVPIEVEKYLSERWGDYMKLPPIEEIKKYQHAWKWSDTETFPGFKENGDYKDEKYLLA